MKKYISEAVSGEQVEVCGRLHTIIHMDQDGIYTRLVLFPMQGKILAPVQVIMRQDVKIRVYPSREKQLVE